MVTWKVVLAGMVPRSTSVVILIWEQLGPTIKIN